MELVRISNDLRLDSLIAKVVILLESNYGVVNYKIVDSTIELIEPRSLIWLIKFNLFILEWKIKSEHLLFQTQAFINIVIEM